MSVRSVQLTEEQQTEENSKKEVDDKAPPPAAAVADKDEVCNATDCKKRYCYLVIPLVCCCTMCWQWLVLLMGLFILSRSLSLILTETAAAGEGG